MSHPCEKKNGGCSHLCFIVPGSSSTSEIKRECACPDFMKLGSDLKRCHPYFPTTTTTTKAKSTVKPSEACGKGYYKCHSSLKCISETLRCDGKYDCPEQDDELRCENKPIAPKPTITSNEIESEEGGKPTIKIAVAASIAGIVVLLFVVVVIVCKRRRGHSNLRYA